MSWRVALVGRQNSGKTSALMHLTGSSQRPVNFPGTSVERTEAASVIDSTPVTWIDLPGLASTSTSSPDEAVTLEFLRSGVADALCVVMDASKLSIELRLLQELAAFELPLVIALTKEDVALERGARVDIAGLKKTLGLEVVSLNGRTGEGAGELGSRALASARLPSSTEWDPEGVSRAVTQRLVDYGQARSQGGPRRSSSARCNRLVPLPRLPVPSVRGLLRFHRCCPRSAPLRPSLRQAGRQCTPRTAARGRSGRSPRARGWSPFPSTSRCWP